MTTTISHVRNSNFIEKLVLSKTFWIVFCSFLFAYPVYRSMNRELPPELPVIYELPEFKLVDENGKAFGSGDLNGKPYIANFHFTSCPTVCPEIMKEAQTIQKRIRGLGTNVAIVSFTVDPDTDSPKVLFDKARELKANPYIWKFLTGSRDDLKKVILGGFRSAMGEREELDQNMYDIAHSSRFFLVDEKGRVRSIYSKNKEDIDKMMIDLGLLINRLVHHNERS